MTAGNPKKTMMRIDEQLLAKYRKWAATTGRHTSSMVDEALRFALEKQSEVERRISNRLKGEQQ